MVLLVFSWFASCSYVHQCLNQGQARLGESATTNNPSILTELFPQVIMAMFGLVFVLLALVAEILLCRYLDRGQRGESRTLVPSALFFILVSLLATCRGICINANAELFCFLGAGCLVSFTAALCVPGEPFVDSAWIFVLPQLASAFGLLVSACLRLRRAKRVLTREERILRVVEQLMLIGLLAALGLLLWALAPAGAHHQSSASSAGAAAGCLICLIAALRARMAVVESRHSLVRNRLLDCEASGRASGTGRETRMMV